MDAIFILAFCGYLLAPGYVLTHLIGLNRDRLLSSIALSYATFTLCYLIAKQTSSAYSSLSIIMLSITLASIIISAYLVAKKQTIQKYDIYPISAIIFSVVIYNLVVGAYIELPSDIYAHLQGIQEKQNSINQGAFFVSSNWWTAIFKQGPVWYHFAALVSTQTQTTNAQVAESLPVVTNIFFLLSVFTLASVVFKRSSHHRIIALLSTFFVAIHMGINIFSFTRYYALGPTTINFCLYFAAITTFLRYASEPISVKHIKPVLFILLLIVAASMTHSQEALFIFTICSLLILLVTYKEISCGFITKNSRQWLALSILILLFFIFAYIYAHLNLPIAENIFKRLLELGGGRGLIPEFTVLNPRIHFVRVITLWGMLCYLLFFIHWKRYKGNLFIVAGMLSPLFTVFNPFFVDLFLRSGGRPYTLWRMCYLIPIHFIAADIFILYLKKLYTHPLKVKFFSFLVLCFLILLLLPIKNTWNNIHYSRFPTLGYIDKQQTYKHYQDILLYLESIPDTKEILTDPIMGYLINALTKHNSPRSRFRTSSKYRNFTFTDYTTFPLNQFDGYLLIVNRREQVNSANGKLSHHWQNSVLRDTRYRYPVALRNHIAENPDLFIKLWESNDIAVYELIGKPSFKALPPILYLIQP